MEPIYILKQMKVYCFYCVLLLALFANSSCSQTNEPEADNPQSESTNTKGALIGKFSVSASTQVHFSKGNLQYQASTGTWRFAEKQFDVIGEDNINISTFYTGWIDLFNWGTGSNPTLHGSDDDAERESVFVDWGTNPISNGGNQADLWRTLSRYEWEYLFVSRTNAAILFGMGSINGINGLIILPDNWVTPNGVPSFIPSTTQGLTYNENHNYYYNDNFDNFAHNTLSVPQWEKMEKNGAVFLPAAGERIAIPLGTLHINKEGEYWSSTIYGKWGAYRMDFTPDGLSPSEDTYDGGLSVRLVRNIK